MGNMSYCRHENTAQDLREVWENWTDFDDNEASSYELQGRATIIQIAHEIAESVEKDDVKILRDLAIEARKNGD